MPLYRLDQAAVRALARGRRCPPPRLHKPADGDGAATDRTSSRFNRWPRNCSSCSPTQPGDSAPHVRHSCRSSSSRLSCSRIRRSAQGHDDVRRTRARAADGSKCSSAMLATEDRIAILRRSGISRATGAVWCLPLSGRNRHARTRRAVGGLTGSRRTLTGSHGDTEACSRRLADGTVMSISVTIDGSQVVTFRRWVSSWDEERVGVNTR